VGRSPRQARARLGVAPQQLALYPKATALDNLRLFAGLHGWRGRRARRRIEDVAAALGLTALLGRQLESLSGGQQRRLQTAAALLPEPPVLLLDEPTVGADVDARGDLLAMVRRQADGGAAICYTTHYLTELRELDATIAVLARGRIVARGTQAELLADLPSTLWLRFGRPPSADMTCYPGCAMAGTDAITLATRNPGQDLALFLRRFRDAADSLVGVDVAAPTLDDLYRHLLDHDRGVELNNVG
jgi:ABC-2 type transport system ATP-binding protein